MANQVPDRSKANTFGPVTSLPQIGIPWAQDLSKSDPGYREAQAPRQTHHTTALGGGGEHMTSLPDLNWSATLETQSSRGRRSDDGMVKW